MGTAKPFSLRLPFHLQSAYFPDFWLKRIQVNRRAAEALARTLADIAETFLPRPGTRMDSTSLSGVTLLAAKNLTCSGTGLAGN